VFFYFFDKTNGPIPLQREQVTYIEPEATPREPIYDFISFNNNKKWNPGGTNPAELTLQ